MKPVFLSVCLALSSLMLIVTPATAKSPTKQFSSSQMAKTTVDSLEFKDVMRGLYAGKMTQVYVEDEELLKFPHIGLNDGLYDRDDPSYITYTVALMHPVISYQNHNGEDRYLVIIEKVEVHESGFFLGAPVAGAYADIFIFKDLPNGEYQLVSRNKKDEIFGGAYGRTIFNFDSASNNIQLIGDKLMGTVYNFQSCQMGYCVATWQSLILAEDDFIQLAEVADAAGDNGGAVGDTPMHYSFNSTFKVINDGSKYFPIQVHYYGEMPIGEEYQNIRRVDKTETFYYNKAKNAYSKTKPRK